MMDLRAWTRLLLVLVLSGRGGLTEAADWTDSLPFTYTDSTGNTMPYRLFLPPDPEPGREYPLVLFLHGVGECGTDNILQVKYNISGLIAATQSDRFKSYLVAPQTPVGTDWLTEPSVHLAAEIVDEVERNYSVDGRRIYVTGLSLGGFGTFGQLYYFPLRYAAGVPIASGIGQPDAATVAAVIWQIPIWVFHGSADSVVPVQYSRDIVQALRALGGDPRYTEYPGVNHDSWSVTYADASDTLYPWLFNCVLGGPKARCRPSVESGEAPLEVCFSAEESFPGEGALLEGYDWDFGDGVSGEGTTACHTYTEEGIYAVKLRVTNDLGYWSEASTSVSVHCARQDVTPWTAEDVGVAELHGAASLEDAGRGMAICAGKGTLTGTTDAFHFVHQQVSGNATLSARIGSLEGSQTVGRVGVMFRESLEANAACAAVCFSRTSSGATTLKFQLRNARGSSMRSRGETVTGADVPSVWLKIEKRGDEISGHASTDGISWTELGREVLPGFPASCPVGVLATGTFAIGGGTARTLRADIQDLSLADCQKDVDTLCTSLAVTGPDGGGPGVYTATASAEDGSGDPITYLFSADDGLGNRLTVGPQLEETTELDLTVGTWTISVTVDDQAMCLDASSGRCLKEVTVAAGGLQRPGDVNQDGMLDLSDAIWLLGHLFLGTPGQDVLPCGGGTASSPGAGGLALADVNGDGTIDISDSVSVLGFLFLGSEPPALGRECVRMIGCPVVCRP